MIRPEKPRMVQCGAADRCGITLMEVLVSIGVLSIGLLGAVALIPVAGQQAKEGAQKDAMAIAGRRAFREFSIRGLSDPSLWVPDPIMVDLVYNPDGSVKPRSVCVDPLAFNTGNTSFPDASNSNNAWMPRISVKTGTADAPMSKWQIDETFLLQDDLEFELPDKSGDAPTQVSLPAEVDGSNMAVKRYAAGNLSWFAMLAPVDSAADSSELYTLSIAITRDRNVVEPETALEGTVFDPAGVEFVITAPGNLQRPSAGDWVLLGIGDEGQGVYRWYRVVSTYENYVSLSGPQWTGPSVVYLIIVPRVVAVYSKTIKLESLSGT